MNKVFKRVLAFGLVGVMLVAGFSFSNETQYFEIAKNIDIFTTLYKELNTYYVDDVDPNDLMQKGIKSMLKTLDPYTNFISEAEIENYRFQTTGKYGGIGALIQKQEEFVVISELYEGFGADKAGLIAGDRLIEIDGKEVKGKKSGEVSKLLKGEPGTSIKVIVDRPTISGDYQRKSLEIEREEVKVKNVPFYGMVDEFAYIKLQNFTQKAGKEVEDALTALKEENPEMKGVIFDLRGNPGGLLNEAVNVSNVFIDRGKNICSTKGKIEEWDKTFKTLNDPIDTDIPVAVLTSRGSASASEIVSGSLQDLDRGVVIGQKTFGKGLVQTTRPLSYNTRLKLTTAKYYIPSGRCIQAINYAEKDKAGAVTKIADSLKVAFKTENGRTVFDGGGIDPDIEVERDLLSDISIALLRENLIFHYATKYCLKNNKPAVAKGFAINDSDFNDFVSFIGDKEYSYKTESEELVEELKETAEEEGYIAAIEDEIQKLEDDLKRDKKQDLQKQKKEIVMLLENEIATRFFYRDGAIQAGFKYDKEVKKAKEILSDLSAYKKILASAK